MTLADDGEVLVRGDTVMLGYRNLPRQTAETLAPEQKTAMENMKDQMLKHAPVKKGRSVRR